MKEIITATSNVMHAKRMKEIITADDIAVMFEVSKTKAYGFINAIKLVSDTLGLAGKVHKQDYEMWIEARKGLAKKN